MRTLDAMTNILIGVCVGLGALVLLLFGLLIARRRKSSSAEERVRANWDPSFRKGQPASRHPATVSEMIFTEAEAV